MMHIKSLSPTRRAWLAASLALAWAVTPSLPAHAQNRPQKLATVQLNAGIHNIVAMLARSPAEHTTGLMFRTDMGANEGMLFVFDEAGPRCFWMQNTPLPLSAAFIEDDGTVVNIEDMKPQTVESHCSARPVRYVLEMHRGWFAKRGIKAGSRIAGGPFR